MRNQNKTLIRIPIFKIEDSKSKNLVAMFKFNILTILYVHIFRPKV